MTSLGRTKKINSSPRSDNTCPINDRLAPGSSRSEIQFDGGSEFGFLKPFPFFALPVTRSESPATGFGTGSVSVVIHKGHRKTFGILKLRDA